MRKLLWGQVILSVMMCSMLGWMCEELSSVNGKLDVLGEELSLANDKIRWLGRGIQVVAEESSRFRTHIDHAYEDDPVFEGFSFWVEYSDAVRGH